MITVKILIDGREREAYISDVEIRKSWRIISEKANEMMPQRKCKIRTSDKIAKFIDWEHYSMPTLLIKADSLEDHIPAGVRSQINAIVELEDGQVKRVNANDIIFI